MEDINKPSITIAIATHKPYRMPDDTLYLPVHAGAILHPDILKDMQGDDEGDNISAKNAYYSELTVLWWLWKNCNSDYKSIAHYRRNFATKDVVRKKSKDPLNRTANRDDIERAIMSSRSGIVLPAIRNYHIETVGNHHRHVAYGIQLDTLREVFYEMEPSYVNEFNRHFAGTKTHLYNMFIMPAPYFDAYCEWLFPLLFETERRHNPNQYNPYDARYIGRLSEYLLDVWLNVNDLDYAELPVVEMEPLNILKKGSAFLAAKFFGRKYKRSF